MMMMMRSNSSSREEKNEKIKKMGFINSTTNTTNEWSQVRRGGGGMLKQMKAQHSPPPPPPPQQQQEPLRCPRCDSSNTKFCYYNNYSLSQPRHFCKSCKRYWTRGGTLRNVPVGGGCRKNKRVKRSSTAVEAPASRAGDGNAPAMFSYGNPHAMDLSYALGFSSGIGGSFIRDFIMDPSSNSVVPGFVASAGFVQTTGIDAIPATASPLLASTILQEQQKFMSCGGLGSKEASAIGNANSFKPLCPSENVFQVKFDEDHPVDWSVPRQDQFDEVGLTDLPVSCWNTIAGGVVVGSWHQKESGNNEAGLQFLP